ncbi:MAG: polyphenol oxidase family protein [Gemmatimonadota bacterium]|nr:polyphenol oxidase family protein [Gemmatimonadota bacterium]
MIKLFLSASAVRTVRETPVAGVPAVTHPLWADVFPWLVQGTTIREALSATGPGAPFDMGMFSGGTQPERVLANWTRLGDGLALPGFTHAPQVHGCDVEWHTQGGPGVRMVPACDGHATSTPGAALAVTVADCVPVFVVDPVHRAIALLHAGWRGAASGILARGLRRLEDEASTAAGDVHLHLGPSICGACYEVGPEVFAALGLDPPPGPAPLDLRRVVAAQALGEGVDLDRITVSEWCTLCGDSPFFSHRGGDRSRQIAYMGITR